MRPNCHRELLQILRTKPEPFRVVVMPDFFLDRLINLEWTVEAFSKNLNSVVDRKGGSIDGITQTELRGGNAVNTASALAKLGAQVTPIICTDHVGQQLIRYYLDEPNVDLSHIKIHKYPSITTALELKTKNEKSNVMLRNIGSLSGFGPQHLSPADFEAIDNADYVCVFNWAGTKRFGTELAEKVFHRTKTKGKGKTYYDTADPTPNSRKIPELVKRVLQNRNLDILSVNENEATTYARELEKTGRSKTHQLENPVGKSARFLASKLQARIDLHTTKFSATFTKEKPTIAEAIKVQTLRVTGAGDAWNAGNILGDALELSDECRLALANAVAAYYVSNKMGRHPTLKRLTGFLEKQNSRIPCEFA